VVFTTPRSSLFRFYVARGGPWERRTLVRHIFSFPRRALPFASFSSAFSVPSARTLFLIFGTNENRGIAPSQKEKALRPRCLSSLCSPCEPLFFYLWNERKGYRAVAKRRNAYAAMPSYKSVSRRREKKGRLRRDACPLCVHCALRANHCFFIFETNENRGIAPSQKKKRLRRDALVQKRIAPSQKEKALTPRCLSSLCSLWPLCEPLFFYLWNERKPGYRAVAKRKSAYAAMLVLSVFSVPSVRTIVFLTLERTKTGVSRRREKKKRLRRDACPLSVLCALCANRCFYKDKTYQLKRWRYQALPGVPRSSQAAQAFPGVPRAHPVGYSRSTPKCLAGMI